MAPAELSNETTHPVTRILSSTSCCCWVSPRRRNEEKLKHINDEHHHHHSLNQRAFRVPRREQRTKPEASEGSWISKAGPHLSFLIKSNRSTSERDRSQQLLLILLLPVPRTKPARCQPRRQRSSKVKLTPKRPRSRLATRRAPTRREERRAPRKK
jgi:hypothetical protein